MNNFLENTKSKEANFYLVNDNIKRAIFKAGLSEYSTEDLCLYLDCLIEVINKRKGRENV